MKVLTKKGLHEMCIAQRFTITPALETYLLNIYGKEPADNHIWSEQDIWEQIHKIISD